MLWHKISKLKVCITNNHADMVHGWQIKEGQNHWQLLSLLRDQITEQGPARYWSNEEMQYGYEYWYHCL